MQNQKNKFKFYDNIVNVIKQDNRFLAEDGTLLVNTVYEAAMKMDEKLISLLLNNEKTHKHFYLFSFDKAQRFEPDYVLFLQKTKDEGYEQLQVFIEPKGDHLLEKDQWKEDFLLQIQSSSFPLTKFVDDNNYRIWGFHFFNQNNRMYEFSEDMNKLFPENS